MSVVIAAVLFALALLLLLAALEDAHERGLRRLERAGEDVPWWLPGRGRGTWRR